MIGQIVGLPIAVGRAEVLRLLGYRRRPPRADITARLDALWPQAESLVRARGAALRLQGQAVPGLDRPAGDHVVVGLCTIGPSLEAEAARRAAEGELLESLLLDAFGSAAAEAASDALNGLICARAERDGLHAAPRESPGYGRWPVAAQPELLALLPAADLGVSLTAGHMMTPRKSVSFAVRLGEAAAAEPVPRRCRRCQLAHCAYREEPEAP